ncbi:hypothetical protein YC2023_114328 [Brassica napus]
MIRGGSSYVTSPPSFSNDAKKLLVCTGNTVSVFSAATGLKITALEGHTAAVTTLIVIFCYCWTASLDGTVRHWDFSGPELLKTVDAQVIPSLLSELQLADKRHESSKLVAYVSVEDTSLVEEGSKELRGHIRRFSRFTTVLPLPQKPMTAAAFSGDGTVLAVAAENVITLWNLDKNILLSVLGATLAPITKLCFAEKSEFLVAASHLTKPELSVWNTSKQSLSCSYGLRIEAVTSAVDSSAFAVLALIPETLKKKNMFHRRDGAILLFNGSDPNHAERGSISFLEGDDKSQLRLAYVNGSREYVVFDPRRVLQVTRRQKVSIFLGDFGYTSLYGQLPDYDKKRTESVESLATPFVSSERPWETIFSGSTLNFPPLQKLCGEFFESLMEKRTVVVEWVMIYTKKVYTKEFILQPSLEICSKESMFTSD